VCGPGPPWRSSLVTSLCDFSFPSWALFSPLALS